MLAHVGEGAPGVRAPTCSVCESPWLPACREHPVVFTPQMAHQLVGLDTLAAMADEQLAAALARAVARNPEMARRYGLVPS